MVNSTVDYQGLLYLASLKSDRATINRLLKREVLQFTNQQNQQNAVSNNILEELTELKDRILNPNSHGNDMPLYEQELKDAIEVIAELKVFLDSRAI